MSLLHFLIDKLYCESDSALAILDLTLDSGVCLKVRRRIKLSCLELLRLTWKVIYHSDIHTNQEIQVPKAIIVYFLFFLALKRIEN